LDHKEWHRFGGRMVSLSHPLLFSLLFCFGELIFAQIKYSTPEEVKVGTIIGNIAKDLGLDVSTLINRRFRIVPGAHVALFEVNPNNGALYVHKTLDREQLCDINGACLMDLKIVAENPLEIHYLDIQASDKGQPPMTTDCRVIIKIQDVNDNKPEIEVTSLSSMVPEDSKQGTVISLISVTDMDSGLNGKVICSLTENVPFELKPSFKENMYSLVTTETLDRETVSHYDISITA
uniref:Cadherin domain-containing protein n=1 Tax=Monopterus albus TaxID=43700 RepID=A0A3Q3IKI6_MONAL